MKVRCERDGHVFEVTPRPYPTQKNQSADYDVDGDKVIDCPKCGRGYFHHNGGPDAEGLVGWHSDRPLTIIRK